MAETYGLTPEGFKRKRLDVILQEINDDTRGVFGQEIDLSPESPDGQLTGIIAERFSDLWQLAEDVCLSLDPDYAQKHQLETIGKLNDIYRKLETRSIADLLLSADIGTTVPANSQVAHADDPKVVFQTDKDIIIGASGTGIVSATCTTPGSIAALPDKLTQILTPIAGWNSVTNPDPAAIGQPTETDASFRIRRAESTEKNAQNMVEATRARLLLLDNVEDVQVYENDTNQYDENGLEPHSIHVVIKGGENLKIAETIFNSKSGGVTLLGSTEITIIPAQGGQQIIKFSRPTEVPIYIDLTIKRLYGYTETSTELIKQHIIDYAKDNFRIGDNVIYTRLYTPINQEPRHEIVSLKIGKMPSPSGQSDVIIAFKELATFNIENINITVVNS
jgi:uncharacterized phage protein gp47/JayE